MDLVSVPISLPTLPFQVIVYNLQTLLCSFWAAQTRRHMVIGSTAMRFHMDEALVKALNSGIVDLDMLVACDYSYFERLAAESAQFCQQMLSFNSLPVAFFEFKISVVNRVVLVKYFWHTFRIADIQWVDDSYPFFDSEPAPLYPGQLVQVATLNYLKRSSERVLAGVHDGLYGDNEYRMQKDRARLNLIGVRQLWKESAQAGESKDARIKPVAQGAPRAMRDAMKQFSSQLGKLESGVTSALARLDVKLAKAGRVAQEAKQIVEKSQTSHVAAINAMYDKVCASKEARRVQSEEAVRLKETVASLYARCDSLGRERANLANRVESLYQSNAKCKQIERQLQYAEQRLVYFERDQIKERLLFIDIVQSTMIAMTTYRYALHKATEYVDAAVRSFSLIYDIRLQISDFFDKGIGHGTQYPSHVTAFMREGQSGEATIERDVTEEVRNIGRGDVASAVAMFMESFGPFGSSDENAFMCGWRENENILDYLQRINGYLLASLSKDRLGETPYPHPTQRVYLTARVKKMNESPTKDSEGGLCLRVPFMEETTIDVIETARDGVDEAYEGKEPVNVATDYTNAKVAEESSTKGADDDKTPQAPISHAEWMMGRVPSFLFEIKQDVSLLTSQRQPPQEQYFKEDWTNDPSSSFKTQQDFCRVRSCSNIMTALTSVVWSRISISFMSKIHKHARLTSKIVAAAHENEENAESFGQMFLLRSERSIAHVTKMMHLVDENVLVSSPELFDLVYSIVHPFSILKASSCAQWDISKLLVAAVVPSTILRGAEHFTKQTFAEMYANISDIDIRPPAPYPDPVKAQQLERLKRAIDYKNYQRKKR